MDLANEVVEKSPLGNIVIRCGNDVIYDKNIDFTNCEVVVTVDGHKLVDTEEINKFFEKYIQYRIEEIEYVKSNLDKEIEKKAVELVEGKVTDLISKMHDLEYAIDELMSNNEDF